MLSQRLLLCRRREREQPALAATGSLVTARPELLITRFGVGESIFNRVRLLELASNFSLGNDEITNPFSLRRVRVLFIIMVHFFSICEHLLVALETDSVSHFFLGGDSESRYRSNEVVFNLASIDW